MYVVLLFSSKAVFFLLASLHLWYQIKIYTILYVSSGTSLSCELWVSPTSWYLWPFWYYCACVYCGVLGNCFGFLQKINCMFLFPKIWALSSIMVVGDLKLAFQVEVDCWKRLPSGLEPPSILGFSYFTIGWSWIFRPTQQLVSRVLTQPLLLMLIVTPTGQPIGTKILDTRCDIK